MLGLGIGFCKLGFRARGRCSGQDENWLYSWINYFQLVKFIATWIAVPLHDICGSRLLRSFSFMCRISTLGMNGILYSNNQCIPGILCAIEDFHGKFFRFWNLVSAQAVRDSIVHAGKVIVESLQAKPYELACCHSGG